MKISLYKRNIQGGKVSLFVEYYKGSEISADGKRKHIRDFENLKIYIYKIPKTVEEKRHNKETLALAESILAIRQSEYVQGRFVHIPEIG